MSSSTIKYRSSHRDAPRVITLAGPGTKSPKPGSIRYGSKAPSFSKMLADAKALNRTELKTQHGPDSASIIQAIDSLHALAAFHAWTFNGWADAQPHEAHEVLFSCFHKTLLSLHAAHELTLDGLYGVARPHLRQAFESLMIAKFCATDPESDVFDKWIDGLDLYFTNAILKKLAHPPIDQFSDVWRLLCQWSHATVYANQVTLNTETTVEESGLNFALLAVLLSFTSHLLNTHILTPSIKYYARRYGRSGADRDVKAKLKEALSMLQESLGSDALALVRHFKATWRLK